LHPVEQVSWTECREALRRLDLVLPTEAQWEYGARGGTTTPWWSGADAASLRFAGNLGDRSRGGDDTEPWDDGHPSHAPVGSFAPNPFGLYDVTGNVLEWCRDECGPYVEFNPGDGLLVLPELDRLTSYTARGGSFYYPSRYARMAVRAGYTPGSAIAALGVRPARSIEH
jgi:formylglycine-generating enzyme required for sulfatase activity